MLVRLLPSRSEGTFAVAAGRLPHFYRLFPPSSAILFGALVEEGKASAQVGLAAEMSPDMQTLLLVDAGRSNFELTHTLDPLDTCSGVLHLGQDLSASGTLPPEASPRRGPTRYVFVAISGLFFSQARATVTSSL